jgi:hypothetical protein
MNEMQEVIDEFKKAGWLFAILGGLGALARLILTDEKYNTTKWIRMIIAGAIVGMICYFATYNADIDPFYKSVLCSVSGSIAPELFNWFRKLIINKLNNNG